ncbi:magnesium transporter [Flexibacter flexilis DSM 6793]|uniref:Magnesium transporter n=1 Tax=Flexibacter flexilis DSM 6793 TaxID=927664 RepID=A0A1I1FLN5_9BACT|nr:CorA family divalent cation transporter [Flexibacter flexilis]SFC00244.1 magnesium transporter [Flexibacter flexilis DSM 6793]
MINTIKTGAFRWLDIVLPTSQELEELAQTYALPSHYVNACLDPEHLPRFQVMEGGGTYVMLRQYMPDAEAEADTIREMTQKIAIFYGENFLITIHRKPQQLLDEFFQRTAQNANISVAQTIEAIVNFCVQSYELPIEQASDQLEDYEEMIILKKPSSLMIQRLFYIKRRMNLIKRLLSFTHEIALQLPDLTPQDKRHEPVHLVEKLSFRTEQVLEMANSLMNLHLALESHRTNEVMRVLTLFSVFFMPITFIAGVYGMNFSYMPELQHKWGYPIALLGMLATGVGLFVWFKRKGWLR